MAQIKKESLVDQVYQQLRESIITLRLPLGSHVNVNELQAELGVSCTPIREAVNRLTQEGLMTYENNVGATILTLSAHDVQEIQELAFTLQKEAVRLSMQRGDREQMYQEIEGQLNRYHRAGHAREEVQAVHELIRVFYHHCGNGRLDRSMIAIQGQQLLLRYLYCTWRNHRKDDVEFQQILQGVRDNNETGICRALEENARRARPDILRHLEELRPRD